MSQILHAIFNRKHSIVRLLNNNCGWKLSVLGPIDLNGLLTTPKRAISRSTVYQDKKKSIVRHNYCHVSEELINRQVNMELYAAYWYKSLQHHFDRDDVALPGFSKFFKVAAQEEVEHADKFMEFQIKRGGRLKYSQVEAPPMFEWTAAIAIAESIELEKQVTESIEEMATKAGEFEDHHLNDFLCTEFLVEQYSAIKQLSDLLTRIKRAGPGTGLIIVDNELQEKLEKNKTSHTTNKS